MAKRDKRVAPPENHIDISPTYYLGQTFSTILRWGFLLSISYVILYPLLYMSSMAFRATADFYDITVVWIPRTFTLDHFKYVIMELKMLTPLVRTVLISTLCTLAELILTSTVGYGFARFRFKGSNLLFGLVILTIVIPPQMLNMANYLLMRNFDIFGLIGAITGELSPINLIDSLWAFILPAISGQGIRAGLLILIFRQFYSSLPVELEEASLIDGCGFTKTYLLIMAPNLSNTFFLCAIFGFVWYWTDYYYSLIYLPTWHNLALRLERIWEVVYNSIPLDGDRTFYNVAAKQQATCLLFIAPLVIFFLLIQKTFSQSIEKSGLVG